MYLLLVPVELNVVNVSFSSKATRIPVVRAADKKNKKPSQAKFEDQKMTGFTPVMSWTCLALVILSVKGNMRKADRKKLTPNVRVTA